MSCTMSPRDRSDGATQTRPASCGALLIGFVCALACALAAGGTAQAQPRSAGGAAEFVLMTLASVEGCIETDELLRKSCARVGGQLPDKTKTYCELPATPFKARTAHAYAAFKEFFRAEIEENEADFAHVMRQAHASFDKHYAQMRAGRISMMDLESLSRELAHRCRRVEHDWLAPGRRTR